MHHMAAIWRREFANWPVWVSRVVVLAYAVLAGLVVVAFTWLSEQALEHFYVIASKGWWVTLIWMPAITALVVWLTLKFAVGAGGSGIPQVIATLESATAKKDRSLFVSTRLSLAKMLLTALGLLGGLSLGREGPSVQIAAGVMHNARRWLPSRSAVSEHGLLVAGGSAGIAAAFNTPLAGVVFAIEELSRKPEQRSSGLLVSAIVLAGLIAVSAYGNSTYFGVIRVPEVSWELLSPGLVTAIVAGLAGGLFSRLVIVSLGGTSADRISRFRRAHPVWFGAACGLVLAVIALVSGGATYGGGYEQTKALLEQQGQQSPMYALLKFVATWITTWSGVPGGIFAPCLAVGAALGSDIAQLMSYPHAPALIALGMAGFLAAVTQAPLTSFIIVMEMVDGHAMVLSLMTSALLASATSRLISTPLYSALARMQLQRLPLPHAPVPDAETVARTDAGAGAAVHGQPAVVPMPRDGSMPAPRTPADESSTSATPPGDDTATATDTTSGTTAGPDAGASGAVPPPTGGDAATGPQPGVTPPRDAPADGLPPQGGPKPPN